MGDRDYRNAKASRDPKAEKKAGWNRLSEEAWLCKNLRDMGAVVLKPAKPVGFTDRDHTEELWPE